MLSGLKKLNFSVHTNEFVDNFTNIDWTMTDVPVADITKKTAKNKDIRKHA